MAAVAHSLFARARPQLDGWMLTFGEGLHRQHAHGDSQGRAATGQQLVHCARRGTQFVVPIVRLCLLGRSEDGR